MAWRLDVSIDEYNAIFGDSDTEDVGDIEGDISDIDFSGIDDVEESDEEGSREVRNEIAAEVVAETDDEEEEEEWTADLSRIRVGEFTAQAGAVIDVGVDPKADNFFSFMFGEDLFDKIVVETIRYARQKLAGNEQRLTRWRDVNRDEVKAYFGICVIKGLNVLPKVANYWSSDVYMGNEAIKRVMTKNRFEEISQFFHLNDST